MFDLAYWHVLLGNLEPEMLLRWWTNQGPGVWLETVRLQTDLLRQARSRREIPPAKQVEFTLAKLFHAIQKLKNTEEQLHRKMEVDQELAHRVQEVRIASLKSRIKKARYPKKKRVIELEYYELIHRLRQENLSWRQIAEYLRRYHRFKCQYGYLQRVWTARHQELEGQQNNVETAFRSD